jgi:hypothetical protein
MGSRVRVTQAAPLLCPFSIVTEGTGANFAARTNQTAPQSLRHLPVKPGNSNLTTCRGGHLGSTPGINRKSTGDRAGNCTTSGDTNDQPREGGSCELFKAHLLDNVCHRDAGHFNWLWAWLADLVQTPGRKPGVCVVLRSKGKRTGKSKVGDLIQLCDAHNFDERLYHVYI